MNVNRNSFDFQQKNVFYITKVITFFHNFRDHSTPIHNFPQSLYFKSTNKYIFNRDLYHPGSYLQIIKYMSPRQVFKFQKSSCPNLNQCQQHFEQLISQKFFLLTVVLDQTINDFHKTLLITVKDILMRLLSAPIMGNFNNTLLNLYSDSCEYYLQSQNELFSHQLFENY